MSFILNAKKSNEDPRDWIYERVSKNKITRKYCDYRAELQPIRNQGKQGTCFAQTAACVKEWQEKKDYNFNDYFSPQFFYNHREYWNNNVQDGKDKNEDYGMTGRDVMRIMKNIGICTEKEYPYGLKQKSNEISKEIKNSAKKHIINGYARVNTLIGLQNSLKNNGPCLIAFPVYNHTDQMWIKNNENKNLGGHAMTVVGYNNKSFIIRNSWGPNWGDKGYCYYHFKDWGCHWEAWTTIDLETISSNSEDADNSIDTEDLEQSIDDQKNEPDDEIDIDCWNRIKILLKLI